ncbi:N-acetyltransferase ESCO1 [Diabrotica virgifera virgifera]|uniref:N-acetyltransferase ESCO1 n=1 Tax=Diabrotica virgifera virgifera TaxID=50390 RepID=A0A6P7F529_DIAVI|nr:N-acetyltransferase ESCO1 [Diabrotica virgifera virgifera]
MNAAAVSEDCKSLKVLHVNNSRRSLFPSEPIECGSDSDLGHISPLNFDSSFENEENISKLDQSSLDSVADIGDYDIIGIVDTQEVMMSPLHLSPFIKQSLMSESPSKMSPTYKLKTPHASLDTNCKLPKLYHKSLLDSSEGSTKRKLSPDNSPEQNKFIKLDPKSSRVRTTLFPEVDFALSTKLFYSNTENIMDKIKDKRESIVKPSTLNKRKPKSKGRIIGKINAGVSHKIRKPKAKNIQRTTLVNSKLSAIGNNAITDYIVDLKKLQSSQQAPKLIINKENTDPVLQHQNQIVPTKQSFSQTNQIVPAITPAKENTILVKHPSCPEPQPNPNKKFFKFAKSKAVVKMNKTIELNVDNGRMSLVDQNKKSGNTERNSFDMSDFYADDPELPVTNIENILSCLEETSLESKITLQAHTSIAASENSILLHQPMCTEDLILSPISQMCDVTSGLALNSPKRGRNLTPVLTKMSDTSRSAMNGKLFPVFYPGSTKTPAKIEKSIHSDKQFKKLSNTQMLLDAGQKKFGLTECHICGLVYHMGDPSDEIMHLNYHSAQHILRFQGWKNEKIVATYHNGRIIQILPGDSKIWWKKVSELMHVINQDIGCYDVDISLDNCQAFLYIKKREIAGCLIATAKSDGYKLLSPVDNEVDICSETTYPIKCGIPRLWVSAANRKQGIATEMMNSLKRNFILGYTLKNSDIAFSSPTEQGKRFAQCYFKTNNFFIYYV